ncbi:MAG: FtsW/RodA/SpoVE family cell cycle protein [Lachnospiraceae bacterium]|nr:FtsW/RodA/SpoVE family cell cycle protein [Lachnospiraceae bacterium]
MAHIVVYVSRFILVFLFAIYTYDCFAALRRGVSKERQKRLYHRQVFIMYTILIDLNLCIFVSTNNMMILLFMLAQMIFFGVCMLIYKKIYKHASYALINNMCMLMTISFSILARLDMGNAIKQFVIAAVGMVATCFIPALISKLKMWNRLKWIYAIVGIAGLLLVLVVGSRVYGAKININLGPIAIQPSEFIKIIFVFFVAAMLYVLPEDDLSKMKIDFKSSDFRKVLIATLVAGAHVLILVASKDLGGATIFLFTYIVMLYVATRKPLYLIISFLGMAVGGVLIYLLFNHVKVRVAAWLDPLGTIQDQGYQVSQSLFAIGTGGWFGSGLCQGMPDKIPVVSQDFIFAAISEELGAVFALCLIFVCISCIFMFFNIAMEIRDQFYKLIALGLGTLYGIQVFITLGGVTKFIPSTGVTLPLVSYGGSSLLSTMVLFAIIQGLYCRQFDDTQNQGDL